MSEKRYEGDRNFTYADPGNTVYELTSEGTTGVVPKEAQEILGDLLPNMDEYREQLKARREKLEISLNK